ncbi:MAG TPA: hypothetical protein VM680_19555 [Verrucomicrobiae bacterium]|nr:hypothetical protein [Verrucomicrobiae bacterium]
MNTHNLSFARLFFSLALVLNALNARAQSLIKSGLYEIFSGAYTECCGIAGQNRIPLPNPHQRFVKLNIDPQSHIASMSILGEDLQTVFAAVNLCPPPDSIPFSFNFGFVFPDHIVFQVDPGPRGLYWNYTLTNSPSRLSINGQVGLAQNDCADVPDKFTHTDVDAYFVAPPTLEVRGYSQNGPHLVVHGRAGWLTIVEVSSDLKTWVEISREIMPATRCATCPELSVFDTGADGTSPRFYRSYQRP